jgi:hypothetical protein
MLARCSRELLRVHQRDSLVASWLRSDLQLLAAKKEGGDCVVTMATRWTRWMSAPGHQEVRAGVVGGRERGAPTSELCSDARALECLPIVGLASDGVCIHVRARQRREKIGRERLAVGCALEEVVHRRDTPRKAVGGGGYLVGLELEVQRMGKERRQGTRLWMSSHSA